MSGTFSRTLSEFSKRPRSEADYSLDPSEGSRLHPELIRAVPLNVCLAGWGKHFQTSGGVAKCQGDYELSQVTDHIDDFISHDWKTSRFDKFLALIWTFNCRAAMISSTVVSLLTGILRIYADETLGYHWWPACFGYLAFAFTVFFWQRIRSLFYKGRQVFLDVLCISQDDEVLKRQGILGLPSFLHCSRRLTILWSSEWSSRLWCVFELATFLSRDSDGSQCLQCSPGSHPLSTASPIQLAQHLSKENPIQLVPVKMGSVLLLQVLCWIALAVTHALMLDLLGPQFDTGDKDIPQVRQQLFQFYLLAFAIFALVITLILPSFIYVGQRIIRELTELPAQLQEFRVQDAKCFCCTNNHQDPTTGKVLPCDRVLVHRMLERWFSSEEDDDSSYLDRFNTVVREELSIILLSEGGSTLRFRDAFYASWSCTIPVISDFIPWWANSNLSGVSWFLWFLRGFMLWSYNGIVMMVMMRVCVIVWKLSLAFLDKMPRFLLLTQVLEAKKVLTDFALSAWSPVAAQSSAEELSQHLLPTALRMTMLGGNG
eukprot:Skav221814  [mRNA]  locus=scaffold2435:189714:194469:- [translate_table: standard]